MSLDQDADESYRFRRIFAANFQLQGRQNLTHKFGVGLHWLEQMHLSPWDRAKRPRFLISSLSFSSSLRLAFDGRLWPGLPISLKCICVGFQCCLCVCVYEILFSTPFSLLYCVSLPLEPLNNRISLLGRLSTGRSSLGPLPGPSWLASSCRRPEQNKPPSDQTVLSDRLWQDGKRRETSDKTGRQKLDSVVFPPSFLL